eukprot:TRINITY_DN1798_c0_g1_i3.p3 TRINITY_DN1798_c0_g1~~TRINITY_DN1798_c0_g1_i3.p3  ORF type:complete len:262 (-),score=62.26 TRINITY_DN1798_c0_g1_i3:137-922(-)
MQEAFMQKLRKMQETKQETGEQQQQQEQQYQPQPLQQQQQPQPQQQQQQFSQQIKESKIESPSIVTSQYTAGPKKNNLFEDEDDEDEQVLSKPSYQPQISKISEVTEQEYQSHLYNPQKEIDNQDLTRQVVAPTLKKDIFGDDEDEEDDSYTAFLKRDQNTEIRKAGNLFAEEDDNYMFGAKQQNLQGGLPSLPPLRNDIPINQETNYQFQQPVQQSNYQQALVDSSGKTLPSFDFEPQKKSLLPKAKVGGNAFDLSLIHI